MRQLKDRVGLGWRHEISSHIWIHADRVDVIEVMLEDYLDASSAKLHSLKTLAREIPSIFHGVSLGLASTHPVDEIRLSKLNRLLDHLNQPTWSEHLAFVRAGGFEIGHWAAPPRTAAVIEGTLNNLERVRQRTGYLPVLENIATLMDPPGSIMSESSWVTQIADGADAGLLLNLHNLSANAVNLGLDPFAALEGFPLHRVRQIHLSGGQYVHAVPDGVYSLLVRVGELCPDGLTVIVERDGRYPHFQHLLFEIEKARGALARGRQNRIRPDMGRLLQLHRQPTGVSL